jgi:hypothetical protein
MPFASCLVSSASQKIITCNKCHAHPWARLSRSYLFNNGLSRPKQPPAAATDACSVAAKLFPCLVFRRRLLRWSPTARRTRRRGALMPANTSAAGRIPGALAHCPLPKSLPLPGLERKIIMGFCRFPYLCPMISRCASPCWELWQEHCDSSPDGSPRGKWSSL